MNTNKIQNIKLNEINNKKLIKQYCPKSRCKWFARRYKYLSYIRLTKKKNKNSPDKIEFLERDKKRKNKLSKNTEIIKLKRPIIIMNKTSTNGKNEFIWYEVNNLSKNYTKKRKTI